MLEATGIALRICGLEREVSAEEVAVGEKIAAEVVEVGDALGGGEQCQWGGLLIDVAKDLLGAADLPAVEKELEAQVRGRVDADTAAFRPAIAIDAGRRAAALAEAFLEGFADHVGGAFHQGDSLRSLFTAEARFPSG